ncbi:GNAT family N-acetyltransferase [Streptomyces avermitilis]|uniref:GNAT family N-acetyltransferase n=1 Tax=Streptomyces avermitilis TaxID=33903 RepID=UPI0034065DB5
MHNVATDPRFRSRGYATTVVTALLDVERGCTYVELRSAAAGRTLYQRLGFTKHTDLIVLKPPDGRWSDSGGRLGGRGCWRGRGCVCARRSLLRCWLEPFEGNWPAAR